MSKVYAMLSYPAHTEAGRTTVPKLYAFETLAAHGAWCKAQQARGMIATTLKRDTARGISRTFTIIYAPLTVWSTLVEARFT